MSRPITLRDPNAPASWQDVHGLRDVLRKVRADYLELVHGLGWSEEEFFERAVLMMMVVLAVGVVLI